MFKLQSKLQSMDVNKNTERYKFHHGHRAFMNSKNKINKTFDLKTFEPSQKIDLRQNLFERKNKISPIYFYRKVNTPYKYSMTSVPEYLIKTNEEKNFVDKLYQSITDEAEKNLLNNLINKKKLYSRKDFYKPQILEVQNLLHYKTNFYSNPFNLDTKDTQFQKKQRNNSLGLNEPEKYKTIKADDDKYKNLVINTCPTIENNSIFIDKDKKNNTIQNRIKEEISKDNQIKFKYKLSDVFNLRKEPVFTNKSAEKYLFNRIKKLNTDNNFLNTCPNMNAIKKEEKEENKFYISSESKSDWIPNKLNNKKMGTHSSVAYNILSPLFKGENRFITATELNKNNLYNESPTFHRVKSISEFIDLTRVSATNTLECFNRNVNKKIPDFKFKASVATNQSDEYHINRDLIEKPI